MKNVIAIGIDPGTHSGISIYNAKDGTLDVAYNSLDKFKELGSCYWQFWLWLSDIFKKYRKYRNKYVAYEFTNFSTTTAATKKSGGFQGLILVCAQLHGFKVVGVNTASVKKHAGHGRYGKKEMLQKAREFCMNLSLSNQLFNDKINNDRLGDMADSIHVLRWLMDEYLGEEFHVS